MSAETVLALCGACLAFGVWWGRRVERARRQAAGLEVDAWLSRLRGGS